MTPPPVRPELFDILIEYAVQVEHGDAEFGFEETSPLLTFCRNFYLQFFENELETAITAVDQDSKAVAVRVRLKLEKRRPPPLATIRLIVWFEKLCDIEPDVLALDYGGSPQETFDGFHRVYITTLLKRIVKWATARKYVSLRRKAEATVATFLAALDNLPHE